MSDPKAYKKSSFGPAFFFLTSAQRRALANYYAFCRLADDIVDEPQRSDPEKELNDLAAEIQRIYADVPSSKWGEDMRQDVLDFQIPLDRFELLLEGMQADLEKKRYATFEELDWYLYRVAVIVGKATLDILGVTGLQADELAQSLGRAVQLTNIVRDVYDDAKMGRVYLPCDISAQDVLEGKKREMVENLLIQTAARARENYAHAFKQMDQLRPVTMLPCRIMGYVYLKNLAKIEKSRFKFTKTIKLNKFEKLQMVCYAISKTFF